VFVWLHLFAIYSGASYHPVVRNLILDLHASSGTGKMRRTPEDLS
jgi:hypothetical protein